jgi:hypothetical protein
MYKVYETPLNIISHCFYSQKWNDIHTTTGVMTQSAEYSNQQIEWLWGQHSLLSSGHQWLLPWE